MKKSQEQIRLISCHFPVGVFPGYRHDEESLTKRAKPSQDWKRLAKYSWFKPKNLHQLRYAYKLAMQKLESEEAQFTPDAKERKHMTAIG